MNPALSIPPARLREFFHPGSIALVGATDASRWSVATFQNLKIFGFPGPIFCVNPRHAIVHEEPAVKRLSNIGQPVDPAFIMVPTHLVYPILQEAAAIGIRNVVILTSGFSEMGARGQALEQELLEFARHSHAGTKREWVCQCYEPDHALWTAYSTSSKERPGGCRFAKRSVG